jgi:hypothetical protein
MRKENCLAGGRARAEFEPVVPGFGLAVRCQNLDPNMPFGEGLIVERYEEVTSACVACFVKSDIHSPFCS